MALQGKNLVLAGYGRDTSACTVDIISARFLSDGTWDKSYRGGGLTTIDVASQHDRRRAVRILPDQRILIVGQGKQTITTQECVVVLLTPNGQPVVRLVLLL